MAEQDPDSQRVSMNSSSQTFTGKDPLSPHNTHFTDEETGQSLADSGEVHFGFKSRSA